MSSWSLLRGAQQIRGTHRSDRSLWPYCIEHLADHLASRRIVLQLARIARLFHGRDRFRVGNVDRERKALCNSTCLKKIRIALVGERSISEKILPISCLFLLLYAQREALS